MIREFPFGILLLALYKVNYSIATHSRFAQPNIAGDRGKFGSATLMFTTSTLLLPMSKLGICPDIMPLLRSIEIGVEILEAMDKSVVARKSVDIIRQYLQDFRASGAQEPP